MDEDPDEKDEFGVSEFQPGAKNQNRNKAIFRKKFGVEKALPGFYILDAKICPERIEYVVKVVKYVIPENEQKIKTYMKEDGGDPTEETL